MNLLNLKITKKTILILIKIILLIEISTEKEMKLQAEIIREMLKKVMPIIKPAKNKT